MSENETEPQDETETPDGPEQEFVESTEPPEPGEAAESGAEPAGPQEPTEEPTEGAEQEANLRSEKEIEKAHRAIDKLREHVANRVGAILGEDAQLLMPCPACGDEIPGFVWPPDAAPVAPEKIGALSAYIGLPDLTKLENAKDATQCADCKGHGEVLTHSLVPGQTTKMCSLCAGKGWTGTGVVVRQEAFAANGGQTEAPVFTPPAETELPPEAEALRRMGYLVIPPTQPVVAA